MKITKLLQELKFKIESRKYSLDLDELLNLPTRTNVLLRLCDKGFWNAFTLTISITECKFLMIDSPETGELYITNAPMDLILKTKDYNSSWYIVKAIISSNRDFLNIIKFIKSGS